MTHVVYPFPLQGSVAFSPSSTLKHLDLDAMVEEIFTSPPTGKSSFPVPSLWGTKDVSGFDSIFDSWDEHTSCSPKLALGPGRKMARALIQASSAASCSTTIAAKSPQRLGACRRRPHRLGGSWSAPQGGRHPRSVLVRFGLDLPTQEFDTLDASAFSVITNLVTPFWLLMVLAPGWKVTERVMKSPWPIILCALVQLTVVGNGLLDPDVADRLKFFGTEAIVKLSAMKEMRAFDSFVSEEWNHVLVWDLFAGQQVYLAGREKGVPVKHSLMLCFALGPVGILSHYATTALWTRLGYAHQEEGK